MTNDLLHIAGNGQHKILILDDFLDNPQDVIDAAAELAPFPPASKNNYPGLRKHITRDMASAANYVQAVMQALQPIMAHFYDGKAVELLSPSFSMVTQSPSKLNPEQTIPHFDSVDEDFFAVLHYLSPYQNSGTSLYRHKSTGYELINTNNEKHYIETIKSELANSTLENNYMLGSNDLFEQYFSIEGKFNRIAIYQGALLHSGNIAPNQNLSPDPKIGRLTANLFVKLVQ